MFHEHFAGRSPNPRNSGLAGATGSYREQDGKCAYPLAQRLIWNGSGRTGLLRS